MRQTVFILLWVASLVAIPAYAAKSDEEVLRYFKTVQWPQAYRTQDVALLDAMLHPSFEMIDAAGKRSTKEKELEYIKNNQWNPQNFVYTIERLEIYEGKFAVIDGTGETDTYQYKSSNYLIKEDGQWRAIGSHVSGYKDKGQTP
jgi:hypothetical protein